MVTVAVRAAEDVVRVEVTDRNEAEVPKLRPLTSRRKVVFSLLRASQPTGAGGGRQTVTWFELSHD
jgi:hypothetical protein